MKPKHKKIFYKISYLLFICIISFIDSISNKEYLYLVSNPLIFVILDFIVIRKIMKEVEKDQYRLQKNILNYFFTINNLFIAVIMFLFSCNIFAIIINLFTNIILVTFLRPMIVDPEAGDGVKEYFEKYPDKNSSRYYNNQEAIKKDYEMLKEEIKEEIPVLMVKEKDYNKEKRNKILMICIPVLAALLIISAVVMNLIEMSKSFTRAFYNEFEIYINNEKLDIVYNSEYKNTVIPVIYIQNEFRSVGEEKDNYLARTNKYIINIKEYECINDDKDNHVRVSCGNYATSESKEEINSTNNKLSIFKENKELYNGDFINDITNYVIENGTYTIIITNKNKDDKIINTIEFNLSINEIAIED